MRLSKPLLLLIVGGAFGLGVLHLTLLKVSQSSMVFGCAVSGVTSEADPTQTVAIWNNLPVTGQLSFADTLSDKEKTVLGDSTDEKWIEIDLTRQLLVAHQGNQVFLESPISSGLTNKTPAGEYRIWYKIKSTLMQGGSRLNNTYYYLPNVPYSMFFYGDYGIHGTYWHSNFGHPMSHGCVNSPTPVAEKLFYWSEPTLPEGTKALRSTAANPGTRVIVHY